MAADVWSQLVGLQKIDLSHKSFDDLPWGISHCEVVESLNLECNLLGGLPEDIGDLRCLKVLNVSQNALKCLPRCIFKLYSLVELRANNNQIETIHKDLGNLCDLTVLDVSHNKLTLLTTGVSFLNRLNLVNLSNNQLQSIPHELTAVCGLVEIDISCNKVKKLPCVRNLIHLKRFKAKSNLLKKLPDFSQCRELVTVNFSHNLIEEIDSANLNCQPFLKEIFLQRNKINLLPDDFINLASLQVLDISSNKLDMLPSNIVEFPNLLTLRIANNPFKDIPQHYAKTDTVRLLAFLRERLATESETLSSCEEEQDQISIQDLSLTRYSLSQLRRCGSLVHTNTEEEIPDSVWDNAIKAKVVVVNLSHCRRSLSHRVVELSESLMELHLVDTGLKALPPCIGQLKELQVLVLNQNLLSDICPELALCKYMKELSLSCNRLTEVPLVVYELRLLRTLNLSNNQLTDLSSAWSGLGRLQMLDILDLSNNEITQLAPQLGLLTNLKSLVVTGNRFRQPSYQILSKGTEAVLAYLRNKLPEENKDQAIDNSHPTSISYFIS